MQHSDANCAARTIVFADLPLQTDLGRRAISRAQIDAQQASIDTQSGMVCACARAETYPTVEAISGWNASPGWASVSPNRLKNTGHSGRKL
jgi:hypothetical protein